MHEHLLAKLRASGFGTIFSLGQAKDSYVVTSDAQSLEVAVRVGGSALKNGGKPMLVLCNDADPPMLMDNGSQAFIEDNGAQPGTPPEFLAPFEHVEGSLASESVYYRLLDPNPSQKKVAAISPGSGRRLGSDSIIVSVHSVLETLEDGGVIMGNESETLSDGFGKIGVISSLKTEPEILMANSMVWEIASGVFTFRGVRGSMARQAATTLCKYRAHYASASVVETPTTTIAHQTYVGLEKLGMVQRVQEHAHSVCWQLLQLGMSQITSCCVLGKPRELFGCQEEEVPLLEMTRWELVHRLVLDGWAISMERQLDPYKHDVGNKIIQGKPEPSQIYLVVLNSVDALYNVGYARIEHHRELDYYKKLLTSIGVIALPLAPPLAALNGSSLHDGTGDLFRIENSDDEPIPLQWHGGDDRDLFDELVVSDMGHVLPDTQNLDTTHKWGCFTFSLVSNVGNKVGSYAWQCSCPFHRKNEVTGCKKKLGFNVDAEGSFEEKSKVVLKWLRTWAVRADVFDRQWKHIAWEPVTANLPDLEILEVQRLDHHPSIVRTDVDLDTRHEQAS